MLTLSQLITAYTIRKNFGNGDKKRDAGQTTPDDIIRFDNIVYGKANVKARFKKYQLLDVYRPKNISGKLPVIVSIHGGGWVYGDKDVYQFYCMRLAQRGFAVVNFSYRLAPESKFPAALEDIHKVFNWISNSDNTEKYGFDLNNIFAVGDSAGAHLLTLYASAITNKDYASQFTLFNNNPLKPEIKLRAIALNCGLYDIAAEAQKSQHSKQLLKAILPHGGRKKELELANATTHITSDFPPSFIMTCIGDFLYAQAPTIIQSLEAAGVQHEYHCYGTQEKPLWHVFHCDPHLIEAVTCNDDECAFFKTFFHAKN